MNLAKEVLQAQSRFLKNYREANVWQKGLAVMAKGEIKDNKWYVHKVGCFLVARLSDKKKKGDLF